MCVCIEESVLKYRCCGSYNIVITFTKLMSLTQTSLHIFSLKRKKNYKVFRDYVQIFFYDIMDCIRKIGIVLNYNPGQKILEFIAILYYFPHSQSP